MSTAELTTVRDFLRHAVSLFRAAKIVHGHGTTSVLDELTTMADAIVIDSSPVGATAEVLELLPYADHVVVAIRLDHTLTSATQRTMQLLRSLSTGTLHLVVVGENIERSPYYEYGNPTGKRTKRRPGR